MSARGGSNTNRSRGGGQHQRKEENRPKKESILDLSKYQNKQVLVQFQGGRQVIGILKGWDQLQNLVLDETKELIREIDDPAQLTGKTRDLGLVVTRSTALTQISPHEGFEEIENPFASE